MPDISAIAGATSSLKAVFDITSALVGLSKDTVLQAKLNELTREVMNAQAHAMAAYAEQTTLASRIRELEEKIMKMEKWESEKVRYHLEEVNPGSLAYVINPDAQVSEPFHMLCTNCYEQRVKSILQATSRTEMRRLVFKCPACHSEILSMKFQNDPAPSSVQAKIDFDV